MAVEFRDTGIVLKTADYKDADKIITILSRSRGLITCFALGARRQNSKKSPHLDLLSHVDLHIRGKDFLYLNQANTIDAFPKIKNNLKKISVCLSFFEILTQLVPPGVEDQELYTSLVNFLNEMDNVINNVEQSKLSSKFARYILRHLGYPDTPPNNLKNISNYFENLMNRKIIAKEIV